MSELALAIVINVVLGAAAVLLVLVCRRGPTRGLRLADEAQALALFRMQFPDVIGRATLTGDNTGALLALQNEIRIGLLQLQGRRWLARLVSPGEIAAVAACTDGAIRVKFADYGWPRALLQLNDRDVQLAWLARLQQLTAPVTAHARPERDRA